MAHTRADAHGSIEWANAGDQPYRPGTHRSFHRRGFRGLVGIDFDGDGTVDVMTYLVGPNGDALPETAINNGSPDHGIVDIGRVLGP